MYNIFPDQLIGNRIISIKGCSWRMARTWHSKHSQPAKKFSSHNLKQCTAEASDFGEKNNPNNEVKCKKEIIVDDGRKKQPHPPNSRSSRNAFSNLSIFHNNRSNITFNLLLKEPAYLAHKVSQRLPRPTSSGSLRTPTSAFHFSPSLMNVKKRLVTGKLEYMFVISLLVYFEINYLIHWIFLLSIDQVSFQIIRMYWKSNHFIVG